MSDSLRPHGLQHPRLPCPSSTPGNYSDSCPSSQWCHPPISSSVVPFSSHIQSFPASGSFSTKSVLHIQWPQYWRFNFSISPSHEYSGLISFRIECLDLLVVQGTFKSLLQHHSSKASKKMMLWKCCTHYASKFGKLFSGHRTGKGQFAFQSQRKAMPKNAQTTAQLHSSHTLVK